MSTPDGKADPEAAPTVYVGSQYTYRVDRDVVYARGTCDTAVGESLGEKPGKGMDLALDIYRPEGKFDTPLPAVLVIHGGAFVEGSKEEAEEPAKFFAERGWVAISINYRLWEHKGFAPKWWQETCREYMKELGEAEPSDWDGDVEWKDLIEDFTVSKIAGWAAARDAKAALRFVHANAKEANIDTSRIAVWGESAGALLSVVLATARSNKGDFQDDEKDDPFLKTTTLDSQESVAAIVNFAGGANLLEVLERHDGKNRFSKDMPPMLMFHGDKDRVVHVSWNEIVRAEYEKHGVAHKWMKVSGPHCPWDTLKGHKTPRIMEESFQFITTHTGLKVIDKEKRFEGGTVARLVCVAEKASMSVALKGDQLASVRKSSSEETRLVVVHHKETDDWSIYVAKTGHALAVDEKDDLLSIRGGATVEKSNLKAARFQCEEKEDYFLLKCKANGKYLYVDPKDKLVSTRETPPEDELSRWDIKEEKKCIIS